MKKKQIVEHYAQLRLLIVRAKEDAARWGTDNKAQLLQGINETSAHDFSVYDDAYNKLVQKRMKTMTAKEIQQSKKIEIKKRNQVISDDEGQPTRTEFELARIADALERIAYLLENETK